MKHEPVEDSDEDLTCQDEEPKVVEEEKKQEPQKPAPLSFLDMAADVAIYETKTEEREKLSRALDVEMLTASARIRRDMGNDHGSNSPTDGLGAN